MTIREALRATSPYPIPQRTLESAAARRGLPLDIEATAGTLAEREYRLATADLLEWLSMAPNVSQGGQSYTLSEAQRERMRRTAESLHRKYDNDPSAAKPAYGYKGSRL